MCSSDLKYFSYFYGDYDQDRLPEEISLLKRFLLICSDANQEKVFSELLRPLHRVSTSVGMYVQYSNFFILLFLFSCTFLFYVYFYFLFDFILLYFYLILFKFILFHFIIVYSLILHVFFFIRTIFSIFPDNFTNILYPDI